MGTNKKGRIRGQGPKKRLGRSGNAEETKREATKVGRSRRNVAGKAAKSAAGKVTDPPVERPPNKVSFRDVTEDEAGQRLDNYLFSRLKGVPKSKIYRIIRKGELRVNGKRVKVDHRLQPDDKVRIPPLRVSEARDDAMPSADYLLERLPLDQLVLYESKALLVINKPAGIAVHGGTGVKWGVIEALRVLRPDIAFIELVHRLDRETSGVLLLAKKRSVLKALHRALAGSDLDKRYWVLLAGKLPKRRVTVDLPLEKNVYRGGERLVQVARDGKPAVTHLQLLERYTLDSTLDRVPGEPSTANGFDSSWVEVRLETGRTHQIRVHTQYLGHPIVGDEKYGDPQFNSRFKQHYGIDRMWLHAAELTIPKAVAMEALNVSQALTFKAELPESMQQVLNRL